MTLNLYTTRDAVKRRLALTDADTGDDATLDDILSDVSRQVDRWTSRQFYAALGTRRFTAHNAARLFTADLLAITTLKTDDDGDRTYEITWATTDYDLEPLNVLTKSPPEPYWQIHAAYNGRYGFPCHVRAGVEIVGRWGYYDVLETSSATLVENLDASETSIEVSNADAFEIGQVIEIDSERCEVSATTVNTAPTEDTITVERGVNGTTAATHTTGAAIRVATFPIIGEATLQQVIMTFRGKDAPTGIIGSPEFGAVIKAVGLHPFVVNMLRPFRTPVAR